MEESVSLLKMVRETFAIGEVDVRSYSPLTLAYIGDAIYDVIIRTVVVERANRPANDLHKTTIQYVKAQTQAAMVEILQDVLSEEEEAVYKRGRNAKSNHTAKNASIAEYRKATGLEALLGYLYLQDRMDRILFLVKEGLSRMDMQL